MRITLIWLAVLTAITACGTGASGRESASVQTSAADRPTAPKYVTAAILGNPTILSFKLTETGLRGGLQELEELVHSGLTYNDGSSTRLARLAESTPTFENGNWKLFPDGQVETIWTIKPGAWWHDGTPLTSADLLFTARVGQDPASPPRFSNIGYDAIDRLEAPDEHTIHVFWKRPYIGADTMFTREFASPLPQHLLERTFLENKADLLNSTYWNADFIGTGPFKVQQYVRDSYVVLAPNEQYVLGRPRLDRLTVKFFTDSRALLANVLAGEVDLTMGRSMSLDEALPSRDQWSNGKLSVELSMWLIMSPQFQNPSPAVIGEVEFRRALLHALDRQQIADVLEGGLSTTADSFFNTQSPIYDQLQASVVRYEYDPRRAMQIIEALGYQRNAQGTYEDRDGQPLALQIMGRDDNPIDISSMEAIADYWRQIGIATETVGIPSQRARDLEYIATRPGFLLSTLGTGLAGGVLGLRSNNVARPESHFQGSLSGYANPEFDTLIDKYLVAVPLADRIDITRQIVRHFTEQLPLMPMLYDARPNLIANRLLNVSVAQSGDPLMTWNAHEWDVTR